MKASKNGKEQKNTEYIKILKILISENRFNCLLNSKDCFDIIFIKLFIFNFPKS